MNQRELVRAIAYDIQDETHIYLLLKAQKGYWQNPQGGIDHGESEIEAIIRETREETGLEVKEVNKDTRVYVEYDTERQGNPIHTTLASYAARLDSSKEVVLSPEDGHTESKWVPYNDALTMLTRYPEQIQVFEKVVDKLISTESSHPVR